MRAPELMRVSTVIALTGLLHGCSGCAEEEAAPERRSVPDLMAARNLSEDDVQAALETYTPTGTRDEFYMFSSGGHGGQVIVVGLPSMRILKYIAVFTPEPWQGYGFDDQTREILREGSREVTPLTWGETHHPALSETDGDYDGQVLFINDKANGRIAVVDLRDFVTTQIVASGLIQSNHGATFVTPNTEYVIETSQYPAPLGGEYADISEYDERYRGAAIFWKFDRARRRIVPEESFAVELPPYMQDLADAGRGPSEGWAFINSFNTERAIGGTMEGRPPLESGASQNDMDYLHLVNWRRAEEVAREEGRTRTIANMRVIPLQTAIDEGILYFVPEPKSPHGVDVTPSGAEMVVSGKLDTHVTVYSWERIQRLIQQGQLQDRDPYGVPILPFRESIRGQCEVGLGPLHTQFDDQGFGYTSLFIESKVARWSLEDLELVDSIPVHYNIGHLAAVGGDTRNPGGRYLVAINKWTLDRFNPVGPLYPQSYQLIDISDPNRMRLLYDLPIPMGEPHNAQIIPADRINPISVYTPVGTVATTHERSPNTVEQGAARIERRDDGVHVYMEAVRSHYTPDTVRVQEGDTVHFHITNVEQAEDATHGFAIGSHNVNMSLEPGEHADVTIVAERAGVYPLYCTEFCSALHLEMAGYLLVAPRGTPLPPDQPPQGQPQEGQPQEGQPQLPQEPAGQPPAPAGEAPPPAQ